uniref:ATP-binding protein n=1 Tax=uncultured Draconibacterium sp. TaxID=1573823 RepID=UPI003217E584
MAKKAINRAVSVSSLLSAKHKTLPFKGRWLDSFGEPELTGSCLIWGNSGSGKTRFALQLAKYLASLPGIKVAYNSLEEGASLSLKKAVIETGLIEVKRSFVILDKEPIPELIERLAKHKSPNVIFIDSVQYSGLNATSYKELINRFPKKLFVLISHAEGKHPAGRVAKAIRYDAMMKLRVEGYAVPAPVSRYGGGEPFIIWPEGAAKYGYEI